MKINLFALAAAGIPHDHLLRFNVCVGSLPPAFATDVRAAVATGQLAAHYHSPSGEPWVSLSDLPTIAGVDHDISNPRDPYFVPASAFLLIPRYFEPDDYHQDGQDVGTREAILRLAAYKAGELEQRFASRPPRPFNVQVEWLAPEGQFIVQAIKERTLRFVRESGVYWVCSDEVLKLASEVGRSDLDSVFFSRTHHRIDHDALEQELVRFRLTWPEVYQ